MTQRRQFQPAGRPANFHDDIDRTKLITQPAEDFSNSTLHQRTCNRARCGVFADHYPQTGPLASSAIPAQNDKKITLPSRRKRAGKLRLAA